MLRKKIRKSKEKWFKNEGGDRLKNFFTLIRKLALKIFDSIQMKLFFLQNLLYLKILLNSFNSIKFLKVSTQSFKKS